MWLGRTCRPLPSTIINGTPTLVGCLWPTGFVLISLSAVSEAPHEGRSIVPKRCEGALQIQRLEGSLPGGLWDLYLDEPVLIDCKFAIAVRALGFQ